MSTAGRNPKHAHLWISSRGRTKAPRPRSEGEPVSIQRIPLCKNFSNMRRKKNTTKERSLAVFVASSLKRREEGHNFLIRGNYRCSFRDRPIPGAPFGAGTPREMSRHKQKLIAEQWKKNVTQHSAPPFWSLKNNRFSGPCNMDFSIITLYSDWLSIITPKENFLLIFSNDPP